MIELKTTEYNVDNLENVKAEFQTETNDDKTTLNILAFETILPPSNRFHDLVVYLQEQEKEFIEERFKILVSKHKKYLFGGDTRLSQNRIEISTLVDTVLTGYDSLSEIYQSLLNSKSEKYELYRQWEEERNLTENQIDRIINQSHEGRNYKELLKKSQEMDNQIGTMEKQLLLLKQKKKLVDHQLLETKSLVDIQLNRFQDKLESLINTEKTESDLLFKEKQIDKLNLTDTQVKKIIGSDIEKLISIKKSTELKKERFHDFSTCLHAIFEAIGTMEDTMVTLLKEQQPEKLGPLLNSTRVFVLAKLNTIKVFNLPQGEDLVRSEILALEEGMKLLGIQPAQEYSSSESLSFNQSNSNKSPTIDIARSDRKSNSLSTSPPKTFPTDMKTSVSKATTTATLVNGSSSFPSTDERQYAMLINGIKTSKGVKKD